MNEFGIFSDEGIIEGSFWSLEEAARVIAQRYTDEDEVHAAACCHDHPEHEAMTCELCNAEDEESEDA